MRRTIPIIFILLCTTFITARSQSSALCPANLDFEEGTFNNWECKTGKVYAGSENYITWFATGEQNNRHRIIPASNIGIDAYGLFPQHCPNGSGFSVQLGNNLGGAEAEEISYTLQIPSSITRFSIIYNYAIVLQDPGHLETQQPRFRARIIDLSDGSQIHCVSFDFTASASLPGFLPSPTYSGVLYKDWTPISVDLSTYAGKTVKLEFITSDCTFSQHFGYAYIDVNSSCNGIIAGSTICNGEDTLLITAPSGFQSYQWFSDNTFTTVISTTQSLHLSTLPAVGTVYPVIVTPYPSFGCEDTLYAEITSADKPISVAGPDKLTCSKQETQIGGLATSGYSYSWTPAIALKNPAVAAPYVLKDLAGPTDMIVKTTDLTSGCYSYDTVTVTPFHVDTASLSSGGTIFCPYLPMDANFVAVNPASSVQWYMGNSPVSGATAHTFHPGPAKATTTYWAVITQNGCIDSTRQYPVVILPKPDVGFIVNRDVQCIANIIPYTNTTTIDGNELLSYDWKFSDGSFGTDRDLLKTFSNIGDVTAKLIVTSASGCKDSAQNVIKMIQTCAVYLPSAFTPNNDGLNDRAKPYLAGMKALKKFTIFNRYGNVVFTTTKEGEGWDGTYKGMKQDTGVFIWMLEYIDNKDKNALAKGTITLIR